MDGGRRRINFVGEKKQEHDITEETAWEAVEAYIACS